MACQSSPNTMLASTINAYVYQQYADDDDIQAFFTAYNGMTQAYVTWMANVGLPIYTGLSGSLLDWVANGLYGIQRTSLTAAGNPATGLLNTQLLNTAVLNYGTQATTLFYTLSDDLFQRIITWDFYKGDGKRFCARWLKRRIMRFLVGTNGTDPSPCNPNFVVGTETTSAIGVTINSNVVTVTIDQTLLGNQFPLAPGVLTVFQQAFQQRLLDLPLQYSYVVNIVSAVTAIAMPAYVTSSSPNTTQTTQPVMVTASGGSGDYTYVWSFAPGSYDISIDNPYSYVTTFTTGALSPGQNASGTALCTVTDLVTLEVVVASVPVSITCTDLELLQENFGPITDNSGNPLLLG